MHFKLHCIYQVLRLPASTGRMPAMSLQNIRGKSGNYLPSIWIHTYCMHVRTLVDRGLGCYKSG